MVECFQVPRRIPGWIALAFAIGLLTGWIRSIAAADQPPVPGQAPNSSSVPHWLSVDELAPGDSLSTAFSTHTVQSASLKFAADFCRARVVINGLPVVEIEPYCQTQTVDVTDAVRRGSNEIAITAEPIRDTPAAVTLTLTVVQADGRSVACSTDESWKITTTNSKVRGAKTRGTVPPPMWGLGRRSIAVDPFENYEQWQQAKGGGGASPRFFVAPGFEITQLKVAGPDEGSWVSLASDEQGRLMIAREDQGFLRLTLADDAKSVASVQPIESDLLECRGLEYRNGWLYASANNSRKVFRLKLNDAGKVTEQTSLRELSGGLGHGRNDLSLSSDALHLICGDSVDSPTVDIFDHTSPLRKQLAGSYKAEGTLQRSTLDGQHWELLSAGLRNPYGVAIHPDHGDPFTYDADNEYDLGMPWYRPTRVLQLQTGGDFGYRKAEGLPPRFADQPDNALPLIDIGRGSPTAVIFGRVFQFPAPYRDALFLLDWTYGRVIAVHLEPRGAGYRAATELFLQGKPLNVTDVAAGRDGAMYLITGGRKTQSALYRVSATTPSEVNVPVEKPLTESQQSANKLALRNREIVRRLQSHVHQPATTTQETILLYLDNPDPVVRYAARNAMEKLPPEQWAPGLLNGPAGTTSLRGLMSVARRLDSAQTPRLVDHLLSVSPAKLPVDLWRVWLRTLELCLAANRDAVLAQRTSLESMLVAGWEASRSPVWQVSVEGTNADYRRRAALLLQLLESSQLTKLAARDLLASSVQEDQIAGLMALRNHRPGWTREFRELQLQTLASMPQMVGGEGLPKFHAWLERETSATLSPDEQDRYTELKAALAKPEPLPPARAFVQKWSLGELRTIADDTLQGDGQRGESIFRDALCARCHRFGQRGPWIGPDLTFVAGRFSRNDILDSILNPSKAVAENYRAETIQTVDGKVITGRLVAGGDFRSEKIRLIPDSLRPDQVIELDKKSIESHQQSDQSPMPQGLLDTFTDKDIADLLAYLTGRKRS